MNDLKQKILTRVEGDLAEIENALTNNLRPHLDLVAKTAKHILFSGGKRLRPLLMVLSARLCGYQGEYDKTFSCVFEYLHAATLLHDDLVDGAEFRRGRPVAHAKWGNAVAVLTGDYLLARALSIASETGSLKSIKIIAEITESMSQGEIQQLINKGDLNLTEADYIEVIYRKTAVLMEGACRVGAILAGAPDREEQALSDYGRQLGLAFQMIDDLLDYTADTDELGKKVGADLREGKLTLPLIYAYSKAGGDDRVFIERILVQKNFSVQAFEKVIILLKKYNGLEYTRQAAAQRVSAAKNALSVFGASDTKALLLDIADYALVRKS
ncbi:MAG: polyprenyl synthetase family protein [Thermodesulfobacteriota bacterium]